LAVADLPENSCMNIVATGDSTLLLRMISTPSLALAYAAEGIRVNAVAPGWIATPLTQALQDDEERSRRCCNARPWDAGASPKTCPR
jgi:NAD(P)-dependent dehydrogenase (short-subunit alcohol dehydrogenase family)